MDGRWLRGYLMPNKYAFSFAVFLLFLFSAKLAFADGAYIAARDSRVLQVGGKAVLNSSRMRAFSLSDPRLIETFKAISSRAGTFLSNAAAVSVSSARPAIVTALRVGVGFSGLGYAVALGVGGVSHWYFDFEGSGSVLVSRSVGGDKLIAGQPYWHCKNLAAGSPEGLIQKCFEANSSWDSLKPLYDLRVSENCTDLSSGSYRCSVERRSKANPEYGWSVAGQEYVYLESDGSSQSMTCPVNSYSDGFSCYSLDGGESSEPVLMTVPEAVVNIPENDLSLQLNPQITAELMNHLWADASAQPGYQGIPYSPSNPVLPQDVEGVTDIPQPTVDDFVRPVDRPTVDTPVAIGPAEGGMAGEGSGAINPGVGDQINIGSDPVIGSPKIDDSVTVKMIIGPLLTLFPEVKNIKLDKRQDVCPKFVFFVFNQQYEISEHCVLFEDNKNAISAFMMLSFALSSLIIVLRA